MNAASLVMREWRRAQTVQAAPVAVEVPDRVRAANSTALAALWSEAQALANERLLSAQTAWDAERVEAETLRAELSEAFEGQRSELDAAQAQIVVQADQIARLLAEADLLRAELVTVTQRASTAETRTAEIEHRANDLAAELERVHVVATAERERQAVERAEIIGLTGTNQKIETMQAQIAGLMNSLTPTLNKRVPESKPASKKISK